MTISRPAFRNSCFAFSVILLIASPLFCSSPVLAKSSQISSFLGYSQFSCFPLIAMFFRDAETRQKKLQCYADIDSGLRGWQCKSSVIARENCALRCLSPACYEIIYEGDPLEEGEKDFTRGQEYKYCMHKLSLGESIEGVRGSFAQ
ncbi:hypothetical protein L6164_000200 [Bauhinia variegata]|uniref:Uncharacterized protein n=1 Tax=Bauhinia variegata TaxID=167791 RepID=A0ACB9Q571_BAUVA|nr:hypothetical protein L6164_000200 [Bauhinia variegata]